MKDEICFYLSLFLASVCSRMTHQEPASLCLKYTSFWIVRNSLILQLLLKYGISCEISSKLKSLN